MFDNILTGLKLSLEVFTPFFRNWCYDCNFQGVRKNTTGNAIIVVSKNKISKNIRIFPNKFSGYVCAFCGFVCLKVINFSRNFMTLNLRETKRQPRVRVRARSLVVGDLRSETKGSRFESGCQLCAEVSSLQQSPG